MGNREAEKQSADARNVAPGLAELRQRVEAATGADREIDARVWTLVNGWTWRKVIQGGTTIGGFQWFSFRTSDGDKPIHAVPKYTASVDAALALVGQMLPAAKWMTWRSDDWEARPLFAAHLDRRDTEYAPTPALAILSALLAALDDGGPEGPSAKNEATA